MLPLSLFLICVYVGGTGGLRPCAHMCINSPILDQIVLMYSVFLQKATVNKFEK